MARKRLKRSFDACESGGMNKQVSHKILRMAGVCLIAFLPVMTGNGQTATRSQDYLRDVISLSESLGKAHSVRTVCNGLNDQYWRRYMQRLMDLEAPYRGGLRNSMVNGFNAGFSIGSAVHKVCDADTVAAEKVYAAEGRELTTRLATANIPGAQDR